MFRLDITSIFATISFFIGIYLFMYEVLDFFEFLKFLVILEGTVFLTGAFSYADDHDRSKISFINRSSNSPVRFNQIRYIFGLLFVLVGAFFDKLQYLLNY